MHCCMPADIEDITSKTGNFKKFPVFVKMLVSAVKQQSDSVFIDLLTYQDLELLKSKKNKGAAQQQARPMQTNNKRYLILTYAAEFDRVHYPLPLMFETNPDPERMRHIIKELRSQLEDHKSHSQQATGGDVVLQYKHAHDSSHRQLKEAEYESAELLQQLRVVSCRHAPVISEAYTDDFISASRSCQSF
jgi:coiled-coil domain-containing protein 61